MRSDGLVLGFTRAVGVMSCLTLWMAGTVWASDIGELLHAGQFITDSIGGVAILTIALICRFESRSWLSFVLALLPIYGLVHSVRCFWRLAGRIYMNAVSDPGHRNAQQLR
jgi:hypothetical protein